MPEVQKRGRGCLFYGCLSFILIFLGVILGVYFGTRQAVKYAVQSFTTNSSGVVPQLTLSRAEELAITSNLQKRASLAMQPGNPEPLALGEKELNVLLRQSDFLRRYTNQIYLQPSGTQLQALVSIPLDQFQLWKDLTKRLFAKDLEGRYFNGLAILEPGITNGKLSLRIEDLIVNGKSLPADFTERLKAFDLTVGATNEVQLQSLAGQVQQVQVRDGQVLLHLNPGTNAPSATNF